jgi:hypothetical protein
VRFEFITNPSETPNIVATLVMILWIPAVIWLFQRFPAQKAIVISFVAAWLFLPEVSMALPGIPDYSKISATSYGILISTTLFDVGRFRQFKFGLLDLPMAVWCLCPFISSISNNLGFYDGISSTVNQTMVWGVPYFLGKIYLSDLLGLRKLAIGIFAGGLVYVPLCLFEIRMSPQLHSMFYGGHPGGDFAMAIRLGGYRPTVFMQHGLAVGAWMMAASVIGIWIWRAGVVKEVFTLPLKVTIPVLLLTFVLLRSTGAYALLILGLAILYFGAMSRASVLVYLIIAGIIIYLYLNTMTDSYITDQIIDFLSKYLPDERVSSLEFRFNNEELLGQHAKERIWLGWGGWGRNLLYDDQGNRTTTPDSLWIIAFGAHGLLGLISLYTALLLPVVSVFIIKCPPRLWNRKEAAPIAVLAVTLLLYSIDCLLNAMINPIYILICGGLTGYVMRPANKVSSQLPQRILLPAPALQRFSP